MNTTSPSFQSTRTIGFRLLDVRAQLIACLIIVGTLLSVPTAAVAWAVIKHWNDPITPVPGIDTPEPARQQEFEKRRTPRERALGR